MIGLVNSHIVCLLSATTACYDCSCITGQDRTGKIKLVIMTLYRTTVHLQQKWDRDLMFTLGQGKLWPSNILLKVFKLSVLCSGYIMLQPDANAVVRSGVIPQLRDADMEKEWCSTIVLKKVKVTAEKLFLFSDFKADKAHVCPFIRPPSIGFSV